MSFKISALPAALLVVGLTACNSGGLEKQDYPQPLTSENVHFSMSAKFDKARIEKVEKKTFRTFIELDDKTVREIEGARCHIRSSELSVKFVTPAKVNVPLIKGKPEPLKMTCEKGKWRQEEELVPFIRKTQASPGVYTGGGIAGALIGAAVGVALNEAANEARESRDVWRFVPLANDELPIPLE